MSTRDFEGSDGGPLPDPTPPEDCPNCAIEKRGGPTCLFHGPTPVEVLALRAYDLALELNAALGECARGGIEVVLELEAEDVPGVPPLINLELRRVLMRRDLEQQNALREELAAWAPFIESGDPEDEPPDAPGGRPEHAVEGLGEEGDA